MTRVLAGDLGGTNTRLAIVSTDGGPRRWVAREDFHSRDHDSLEELVRAFLSRTDHPVARATFGVAGPVVAGQASITNLPWVIDRKSTRLNSSHQIISYAVFCLKKKKKKSLSTCVTTSVITTNNNQERC